MTEAVMFWSSGKDSAVALQSLEGGMEIAALVTTVNRPENRVAVHHTPEPLLDRQAEAMGLSLEKIVIPSPCPNAEYESRLLTCLRKYKAAGVEAAVFGDINLGDIRAYREQLLERAGMRGLFPLWQRDTRELAQYLIDSGIRAVVTCVDNNVLSEDYAGREFARPFIESLPATVDPCGENGEFHTFVYNAPAFSRAVPCRVIGTRNDGQFSFALITGESKESSHVE